MELQDFIAEPKQTLELLGMWEALIVRHLVLVKWELWLIFFFMVHVFEANVAAVAIATDWVKKTEKKIPERWAKNARVQESE